MIYTEKENIRAITAVIIKGKNIKVMADMADMGSMEHMEHMVNHQENSIFL